MSQSGIVLFIPFRYKNYTTSRRNKPTKCYCLQPISGFLVLSGIYFLFQFSGKYDYIYVLIKSNKFPFLSINLCLLFVDFARLVAVLYASGKWCLVIRCLQFKKMSWYWISILFIMQPPSGQSFEQLIYSSLMTWR